MEPPAKRLRLMQSVEVDESNPEYIAARARADAKLKYKFESIFAKYQVMPEAMTDEIDIRTGEIVVDRGHLRRLDKEYRRRRKPGQGLLDDLIADQLADELEDEEDEEEEDTRDELAPSQSPEPREREQGKGKDSTAQLILPPPNIHTPGQQVQQVDIPPTLGSKTSIAPENNTFSSPAFAHSTVDWTQFLQFPQTPAGQQARNSLLAQINHAVQQAVTPIISSLMSSTTNILPQNSPIVPASVESTNNSRETPAIQSPAISEATLPTLSSPVPDKQRSQRRVARGVYITRRRELPQSAVCKNKNAVSQRGVANTKTADKTTPKLSSPSIPPRKSPAESYHLPTPSSIEQNQSTIENSREGAILQSLDDIIASGGHFDEDERDLLSIVDGQHNAADLEEQVPTHETTIEHESSEEPIPHTQEPTEEPTQEPQEDVLPSIETDTHEPQSAPQITTPAMADQPSPSQKSDPPTPASSNLKSKKSSSTVRKPRPKPPRFQLNSDSDLNEERNLAADGSIPPSKRKRKPAPSYTPPIYTRRRGHPRKPTDDPQTNEDTNISKDEEVDDLATPAKTITVTIKRESLTPPPPSTQRILPSIEPTLADASQESNVTTPHTSPRQQKQSRHHHAPTTLSSPVRRPPSSSSATPLSKSTTTVTNITTPAPTSATTNHDNEPSTTKLSRSAFLRKVKQAWAKEGRRKSGAGFASSMTPRKGKVGLGRDEGSEDELAL